MQDLKIIFGKKTYLKWGHYLPKIEVLKFLLSAVDVFTKSAWVKPLKVKKGKAVLHDFMERVNKSKLKSNKLWVNQEREFYNSNIQKWLHSNDVLIDSTHNSDNSVVTEKFIKTFTSKIYKKIIANDNKSYLGYFSKLVDEFSNTYYHSVVDKNPIIWFVWIFNFADRFKLSKYKNVFTKGYIENW